MRCGFVSDYTPHANPKKQCTGWPLPHETAEWLKLFSAAFGVTGAIHLCQYIRWRFRGSKLDELPPGIPRPNIAPIPAPSEGPGTELKKLLDSLGIRPTKSCGCQAVQDEMNRLGPDGVRRERERFVKHLREAYQQVDFATAAQAMMAGVVAAWSLNLNPLDPFGSLVDEAIRRAELRDEYQPVEWPKARTTRSTGS